MKKNNKIEQEIMADVEKEKCEELEEVLNANSEGELESLVEKLDEKCSRCKNRICEENGQADQFISILEDMEEENNKLKSEEDPEVLEKRAKKVKIPKEHKNSEMIYKAKERALATIATIKLLLEEGIDYESAIGLGNNVIQSLVQEELAKIQIVNNKNNEI